MGKEKDVSDDDMIQDDEDFYDEDDEVLIDSTEKDFVQIFSSDNEVFFLESSGSWWKNTFNSEDDAKRIVDLFKKS